MWRCSSAGGYRYDNSDMPTTVIAAPAGPAAPAALAYLAALAYGTSGSGMTSFATHNPECRSEV